MAKNAAPKIRPRAILVRTMVQKTSLKRTSRNHKRSTKNPDSAVKPTMITTSATPAMISHRRPRPAWTTPAPPALSVPGTRQPITGASAGPTLVSRPAPQVINGIPERGDRLEDHAVAPRRPRCGDVPFGDEEHRRCRRSCGDDLLLDAADGLDPSVQSDLPRPGDGPAGGQVAGSEEVVEPEGPHPAGRG